MFIMLYVRRKDASIYWHGLDAENHVVSGDSVSSAYQEARSMGLPFVRERRHRVGLNSLTLYWSNDPV